MQCPKCLYQRQPSDLTTPDWQCPACGVAYIKARSTSQKPATILPKHEQIKNEFGKRSLLEYSLTLFVLFSILLTVLSLWRKDVLPPPSQLLPAIQREPIQRSVGQTSFDFHYRGETYFIEPVADYELWGLVVSHNNISGITDIMHTIDSVDIKDLCVIWGGNAHSDYQRVSYSSGDFTCYFQYPEGVSFVHEALSNNHLLSDQESIRELIRQTRIGDQIHLRGQLVNYRWTSKPDWSRNTSTTRTDTGNGACEVIFVKHYEILHKGNPLWQSFFVIGLWLIPIALALKLASFIWPLRRE